MNVWICKKIECLELRKFNGKLCTMYASNIWISRKIEYHELHIFNEKLCTLHMYGLFGLAEKLMSRTAKIEPEIAYLICMECMDLQRI